MLSVLVWLVALYVTVCPAWGQEASRADDVVEGGKLAVIVCAYCHVAARDQPYKPILQPPAPSFESIAQRKGVNADWLKTFMTATHRGLDNPNGMPNAELLDFQIRQVTAYLLSLRKNP
jgi:cytochrome c